MKGRISFALLTMLILASTSAFGRFHCKQACVQVCEPEPPICTKTVMVPKTIQVPNTVEVPAVKIVIPQPDIVEHIPQAPRRIEIPQPPIPQPNIVKYECVPDKIVHRPQAALVRYECPPDADQCPRPVRRCC